MHREAPARKHNPPSVKLVEVDDDLLDRVLAVAIRKARTPRLRRWLQQLLAAGDEAESAPASSERGREKG